MATRTERPDDGAAHATKTAAYRVFNILREHPDQATVPLREATETKT